MSFRHTGLLRTIRRFAREKRGVSAVEFAILLPVMLTLYLGGTEVTQGITIKRKTTMVTRAIGDLVAQDTSVTNAEMTSILSAAAAVVAPYPANNIKVVVSSISIDAQKVAKVVWSDATAGATAHTPGDTVTLPEGLNDFTNTTLIWAEASYTYTPIGYIITGPMTLTDQLYLRPRLVSKICREKGAQTLC
jgi:Flp pilus assembly protein TadG